MFKMNSLSILFLFSWISYSVSTVAIHGGPSFSIPHGNNVKLKCDVSGNDTFEAWKNPNNIVVNNNSEVEYNVDGDTHEIKILNVQAKDGGDWTCISKEGNRDTATLNVLVSEIPKNSAEKTQYLLKDSPGIIKVNILGYPRPVFKWKKDKQELDLSGGRYSTAHNGSLLISKAHLGDNGIYSVAGIQSVIEADVNDISVIVHAHPMFYSKDRSETRTLNGNVTFECNATGVPAPVITWKHGSKVVKEDTRYAITTSGLTITNLKESDVGEYTCVANNSVGTKEQTSKLTVLVPPKIQPISDKEVEKGKELRVYCNVSGDPKPDVKWMKNGKDLPDNQQVEDNNGNMLKIDDVQPSDSGTYKCTASNIAVDEKGNKIVRSQSMKVDVIYPPEFDPSSSINVETSLYKRAEIKCIASGNPTPSLTMSFGKKNVGGTLTNASNKTSLTVSFNVTKDSLGDYTCNASNRVNNVQRLIKVYIPLDRPKIINVKTECDNVTFELQLDSKELIKIERFVVTLNSSDADFRKKVLNGDASKSHFDNLRENTDYDLSVKQETEIEGFGHTSKETFKTKVCSLREINTDLDKNEIQLFWPEAKEKVDHYIVKYRIKGSKKEWAEVEVKKVTKKLKLNYGETYEFNVFVVVDGKTKAYTQPKDVKIPKDTSTDTSTLPSTNTKYPTEDASDKTTKRPGALARKKGLSGGAIAAIVIVIILLVLIAVDVFCCFFNQCGVVHMCAAACTGKSRSKYNVDSRNPDEGTELKERDESKDPEA